MSLKLYNADQEILLVWFTTTDELCGWPVVNLFNILWLDSMSLVLSHVVLVVWNCKDPMFSLTSMRVGAKELTKQVWFE